VNPGGDLLKRAKRRAKFYDFDEYQWQVDAAQKIDPRIHVAVLLGGEAGLRRGEIMPLEWSDVDPRRGQLTIERPRGTPLTSWAR
jgi:integrase